MVLAGPVLGLLSPAMTPSFPRAWLLAVPIVFDTKPHPLGVCSRDLVMVRAGSEQSAKMKYERRHGRGTWGPSMIPFSALAENRRWYPGRVVDLNGRDVETIQGAAT